MSRVVNQGISNALPNFKRLKLSDERNIGHDSLLCKQNLNLGFFMVRVVLVNYSQNLFLYVYKSTL